MAPEKDDRVIPDYLEKAPWAAADLIWTLSVNNVPIYAVRPSGPYAPQAYQALVSFFREQLEPVKVEVTDDEGNTQEELFLSERAAIPGRIVGQATLLNGQTVPEIQPEIRGMANWNVEALVASVTPTKKNASAAERNKVTAARRSIVTVLNKFYALYQNLGIAPEDRAINFVATNVVQIKNIILDSVVKNRFFDKIEVEPSEICRPNSECWVVNLFFFQPELHNKTERKKYRFTVDVSDVVPVTVGEVYGWHIR